MKFEARTARGQEKEREEEAEVKREGREKKSNGRGRGRGSFRNETRDVPLSLHARLHLYPSLNQFTLSQRR